VGKKGGEENQQGCQSHIWTSADGVASPAGSLPERSPGGGGSPRLMRLHQAGGLGVYLDLVQGSHSGRGRRNRFQEKRILCVSPKAGPVPPAAPSGAYI
jgi:hypothetical protein